MRKGKTTRIAMRYDRPVSMTNSLSHANLTTVGFNVEFILRRKPSLAVEIAKLMDQALQLHVDDPAAPEEDLRSARDEWDKVLLKTRPRN